MWYHAACLRARLPAAVCSSKSSASKMMRFELETGSGSIFPRIIFDADIFAEFPISQEVYYGAPL